MKKLCFLTLTVLLAPRLFAETKTDPVLRSAVVKENKLVINNLQALLRDHQVNPSQVTLADILDGLQVNTEPPVIEVDDDDQDLDL
ncbi:MAG: hypothetical protein H6621_05830 [Halobacteriovoraceae bacterium]|nr:hypothetical protein [Halobacteriovoraceae bacterium]